MMPGNDASPGVSKCYVFKSRLQEYAQKKGLLTPVYETIKEGPSHAPSFQSTVVINNTRYDSLPGFSTRKSAEQSAAEVALIDLARDDDQHKSISQPIHETGLCKNLLQEYAQKMNYAIPLYRCERSEPEGRNCLFTCSVEVGGVRYIGGAAKTKKEGEIKAARTALLAIDSSGDRSSGSRLTVVPCKKRVLESADLGVKVSKCKRARNKGKMWRKKDGGSTTGRPFVGGDQIVSSGHVEGYNWLSSSGCCEPPDEWAFGSGAGDFKDCETGTAVN